MTLLITLITLSTFSQPTGVTSSNGDNCVIHITWDSVPSATHYQVYANSINDTNTAVNVSTWVEGMLSFDLDMNNDLSYFTTHIPLDSVTHYIWVKSAEYGVSRSNFSTYTTGSIGDLDNDMDSVFTCLDNCPYVNNPMQSDLDSNGIGDSCDVTNVETRKKTDNVTLYPNPSNGAFTITGEVSFVQIYNLNGKLVRQFEVKAKDAEIDAGRLPRGTYIVKVLTCKTIVNKRLIIK
jgi:hypothetical protein